MKKLSLRLQKQTEGVKNHRRTGRDTYILQNLLRNMHLAQQISIVSSKRFFFREANAMFILDWIRAKIMFANC